MERMTDERLEKLERIHKGGIPYNHVIELLQAVRADREHIKKLEGWNEEAGKTIGALGERLDAVAQVQRHKFIEPLVDWDDKNNGATIYARHIKDDNGNWMKAADVLAALEQK